MLEYEQVIGSASEISKTTNRSNTQTPVHKLFIPNTVLNSNVNPPAVHPKMYVSIHARDLWWTDNIINIFTDQITVIELKDLKEILQSATQDHPAAIAFSASAGPCWPCFASAACHWHQHLTKVCDRFSSCDIYNDTHKDIQDNQIHLILGGSRGR